MGGLCNRSSHKDEEIIILKGDVNDLRTKLSKTTDEKNDAIEAEKREREEFEKRVKELEEESQEKIKEKDLEVRKELGSVIEGKDGQIKELNKKLIEVGDEAASKLKAITKDYEDQLEEMRAVHESVVEEMEAEIKLSNMKAQDMKASCDRRMTQLQDDLRDVIDAAETSLIDRTVCKEDAVEDIIWMVKKINSPGLEIPKPPQRGTAPWRPYENVQFGLKGILTNSSETRSNLAEELSDDGYERSARVVEQYEEIDDEYEEEDDEEFEALKDEDTDLEEALHALKSNKAPDSPAPVHGFKILY